MLQRKFLFGASGKAILLTASALLLSAGANALVASPAQTATSTSQREKDLYEDSMRLVRDKRYSEALEQFKGLERNAPHSPEGYAGEGITLVLSGKPDAAIAALHEAVAIDPHYWMARRELGIIEWQLNRKDEAAVELLRVIQAVPEDHAVAAILGEYFFEKTKYSDTVKFFANARPQLVASTRLTLMDATALIRSGHSEEGVEQLERLSTTSKLEPRERFQIAWLFGEAQAYSQAIHMFQTLPEDFPDAVGRVYGMALGYYESGQYPECIRLLNGLKDQRTDRAEIFSLLGAAEDANGDARSASDTFRRGIEQFPRDHDNYLNGAIVAVQFKDYATATQILSSGIRQISGDDKLFLIRGVVYTLWGDLKKAEADYKRAVSLAPDEPSTYVALGICFMDQGQDVTAANILRQGIRKGMADIRLYYYLVDSLFKQGLTTQSPLYQEATDTVNASIRVNSEFAYSYLQRGKLRMMTGHVQDAIADLEHAQKLEPDSTAILYQLAKEYRSAGRTADANQLFSQLSRIIDKHVDDDRQSTLMIVMGSASAARFVER